MTARSRTKAAPTSATSSTKSDAFEAGKIFATLALVGDRLEPQLVTEIVGIPPTKSWRKGELVRPGPRSPEVVARSGTWWLSTENLVARGDLAAHLAALVDLILPAADDSRLARLQEVLRKVGATARVSCFWHGRAGDRPPDIPLFARAAFDRLPAEIETDFDTD